MPRNVSNTFWGFWGSHRRNLRHIKFLYRRSKCQPNGNIFQSPRRSTNLRRSCYCEESELLICRFHQFGKVCMAIIFQLAFLMMRNKPHMSKLLQRLHKLPARLPLGVNSNPHTYLTFWEPNFPRLRLRDNAHRSTELGGDGAEVGNTVQRTEGLIKDIS